MRLSARASRRTRKCRATKVRNLEQEMRQNNVVFVFARGEKFRQNILIPDFHSPFFFATAVTGYSPTTKDARDSQRSEGETRVATRNLPLESGNEISYT